MPIHLQDADTFCRSSSTTKARGQFVLLVGREEHIGRRPNDERVVEPDTRKGTIKASKIAISKIKLIDRFAQIEMAVRTVGPKEPVSLMAEVFFKHEFGPDVTL